jgi:hypothetical protein
MESFKENNENYRSLAGNTFINNLRSEITGGRSSEFSRSLLHLIESQPELTIKKAWEQTEKFFADQAQIKHRNYPLKFDN